MANPAQSNPVGDFWDRLYQTEDYRYGREPGAFLVQNAQFMRCGLKVLVPGDGEGRNGVWLARQGHDVTIVDASERGLEKARALAEHYGVLPTFVHADLADWTPEADTFDLVVAFYVHVGPAIRDKVHANFVTALKSGGYLVFEGFSQDQVKYNSGGPGNPAMLFSEDQLRRDFGALTIETFEERIMVLDEGHGHDGEGALIRMLAKKP